MSWFGCVREALLTMHGAGCPVVHRVEAFRNGLGPPPLLALAVELSRVEVIGLELEKSWIRLSLERCPRTNPFQSLAS